MTISDLVFRSQKLLIDNSPSILTAVGVVGTVSTALLTGQATYRYMDQLVMEGYYDPNEVRDARNRRAHFDAAWKYYVPAVGTGALTIAAILAANHIGTRRAAGIAAAYSISERAFQEYREKVVEKMGTKSEQSVRDDIAQDRVRRTEAASREVLVVSGDVLCQDAVSGRYLTSNMATLDRAVNELNRQIINDSYASLSDFYDRIGLPHTAYSDEVGWKSDREITLDITSAVTSDSKPCLVFNFNTVPIRDYYKFF